MKTVILDNGHGQQYSRETFARMERRQTIV